MRILIADKLPGYVAGRFQDCGAAPTTNTSAKGQGFTELMSSLDPEVLVVRSTKVTHADVEASRSLALVIRAGAGVNTIDLKACSARGIYVANCPGKNAIAVAELTLGHMLSLDRALVDSSIALRDGRWDKKSYGGSSGLFGRKLAVLGVGAIGREVIARAQAFGMHVTAWSRSFTDAEATAARVMRASSPEEAVRDADIVTVHLALTPETKGRLGFSIFEAMKPGAHFINTSRAEIVDEPALLAALDGKGLRAALDVFEGEPAESTAPFKTALSAHPRVVGSHHTAASTEQAERAVADEVIRIVLAYREGSTIPNCVNLATRTAATHVLVVRHADQVGVLAAVLDALRMAELNVEDMQNIVFAGGEAACARIALSGAPTDAVLDRIRAHSAVFSAQSAAIPG